jgi:hypothetical protein
MALLHNSSDSIRVKATVVAAGMIFIPATNQDARFSDSGY